MRFFGDNIKLVRPLVYNDESDSASLDRVFELLLLVGYSPEHAINMLIPPRMGGYALAKQGNKRLL